MLKGKVTNPLLLIAILMSLIFSISGNSSVCSNLLKPNLITKNSSVSAFDAILKEKAGENKKPIVSKFTRFRNYFAQIKQSKINKTNHRAFKTLFYRHIQKATKEQDPSKKTVFVVFDLEADGVTPDAKIHEIAAKVYDANIQELKSKKFNPLFLAYGKKRYEESFEILFSKSTNELKEILKDSEIATLLEGIKKSINETGRIRIASTLRHLKENEDTKGLFSAYPELQTKILKTLEILQDQFLAHLTAYSKISPSKRQSEIEIIQAFDKYLRDIEEHYNVIMVGQNMSYDIGKLNDAAKRAQWLDFYWQQSPMWVDTIALAKQTLDMYLLTLFLTSVESLKEKKAVEVLPVELTDGEKQTLLKHLPFISHSNHELSSLFGVKNEGAHQAIVDIDMTSKVMKNLYQVELLFHQHIKKLIAENPKWADTILKTLEVTRKIELANQVSKLLTPAKSKFRNKHFALLKRLLRIRDTKYEENSPYPNQNLKINPKILEYIFSGMRNSDVSAKPDLISYGTDAVNERALLLHSEEVNLNNHIKELEKKR